MHTANLPAFLHERASAGECTTEAAPLLAHTASFTSARSLEIHLRVVVVYSKITQTVYL